MLRLVFLSILFIWGSKSFAQAAPDTSLKNMFPDSTMAHFQEVRTLPNEAKDHVYQPEPWQPNPKKAGLYSAILPGAGQFYNQQYWKIPIIYAGVGAAVYFIHFNNDKYQTYKKAYIASLEGRSHEFSGIYDQAALKQLQDGYKRYLDMTMLLTAVGYGLQIIDAIVFAHLKNFDVSSDISMKVQPVATPGGGAGLGLVFHFR